LGSSQASSVNSTLPPIERVIQCSSEDPSPLTTSATTANSGAFQQSVSARRVEYDVMDDGVVLSMPVTSQIPYANNRGSTSEDGYDSDGQLGPFYDAVAHEKDDDAEDFDEEEQEPLQEVSNESVEQQPPLIATVADLPNFQLMTVAQLKDELLKRNLPVNGPKEVLLQRLSVPHGTILPPSNTDVRLPQQPANAITGFAPHARWVELKHHQERVVEPNIQHPNLVGPTVLMGQVKVPKYNFNEEFDHPPFTALATVVKQNTRGRPVFDRQGREVYEQVIRE
jgi:hypothetical protein